MSHEVVFYDLEKYPAGSNHKDAKEFAYFIGYAQGIMYRAFDAIHCNGGASGTFAGVIRTREQLIKGLETIKESQEAKNYLDPQRFPVFFKQVDTYLAQNPDAEAFEIFFE